VKAKANYLQTLLAQKVRAALALRETRQQIDDLKGGAHVHLYVTSARELHIAVWRLSVFPSESEWVTFCRSLPVEVWPAGTFPEPESLTHRGRKIFKAHWRISTPEPFGPVVEGEDDGQ